MEAPNLRTDIIKKRHILGKIGPKLAMTRLAFRLLEGKLIDLLFCKKVDI